MISHVFLSANPILFVKSITGLEIDENKCAHKWKNKYTNSTLSFTDILLVDYRLKCWIKSLSC